MHLTKWSLYSRPLWYHNKPDLLVVQECYIAVATGPHEKILGAGGVTAGNECVDYGLQGIQPLCLCVPCTPKELTIDSTTLGRG